MAKMRKPFQGVWNVVRFNWHFYLFAGIFLLLLTLCGVFSETLRVYSIIVFSFALAATLITLSVTYYVYDLSGLYEFSWLRDFETKREKRIVNINAGFDETSDFFEDNFRNAELKVFDFYDESKHTEVSIKRAGKAYPPHPNNEKINTSKIPLADNSADKVFGVLSIHEIRKAEERNIFFKELHRILKTDGRIFIVEHLRDTANFLAYNIGFFHFHPKSAWLESFQAAGFAVEKEIKITPFISVFVLKKYDSPS